MKTRLAVSVILDLAVEVDEVCGPVVVEGSGANRESMNGSRGNIENWKMVSLS